MVDPGYDAVAAFGALVAGAIYSGVKRAWIYVAGFVAGAFLLIDEAFKTFAGK